MNIPHDYSFYRGYSRMGIGEGPGRPVVHGEQYLAADEPLASDGALLEAAAGWMTLDATTGDYRTIGERFEAWSYFGFGDFRCVVRLIATERYDVRNAYFAHGRAWHTDAFGDGIDPGILIGRSDAFEAPWRNAAEHTRFQPLDALQTPPVAPAEPQVSTALLAHLYQARVHKYPVLLAVPAAEFVAGGAIHALVSFVRAALPLALKRDCRLRIYTQLTTDLYTTDLAADLVVLPEDAAANALTARRDATLLDRTGGKIAGRAAADPYLKYAEAAVHWAGENPESLLRFAERVDRRSWSLGGPTVEQATELPFIYTVAAKVGDQHELDDFVRSLYRTLEARPVAVAWHELVTPADLGQCSDMLLVDLTLTDPGTADGQRLQRMAAAAAAARGLNLDGRFDRWWRAKSPADQAATAGRIFALLDARLISTTVARQSLRGLSADALAEMAATPDLPRIAQLTEEGELSAEWCVLAIERADHGTLVALAAWMVKASEALDELREPMWRALSSCLYRGATIDSSLASALAQLRPPPRLPDHLEHFVLLAELLHRSGRPEAGALLDQIAPKLTRAEDRRALLALAGQPEWTVLRAFRIPSAWERDIADLLIRQDAPGSTRSVDDLLRLGESLPAADHDGRLMLMRRVDEAIRSDAAAKSSATTDTLIARRQWLSWRLATAVSRDDVRRSARFWLTSSVWNRGIEPTYEEWTQVIADLNRGLRALDAETVCRRMPTIRGFEEAQRDDVVTTAYDLKGLAMMAPVVGRAAYDQMADLLRAASHDAAQFLKELLDWAVDQPNAGQPAALWDEIEAMLADVPIEAATSKQGRRLAADALRRGRLRVARALDPSRERDDELVGQMVWALRKGDAGAACWRDLTQNERGAALLVDVASQIADLGSDELEHLDRNGWPTLATVADLYDEVLTTAGVVVEPLPALRLAAVLDSRHSLGTLAVRLAMARGAKRHRESCGWWEAVFAGLTLPRRSGFRSGADRTESAIALLWTCTPMSLHETMREALQGSKTGREVMRC